MKKFFPLIVLLNIGLFCSAQHNTGKESDEKALRYLKEVEWPKSYREKTIGEIMR